MCDTLQRRVAARWSHPDAIGIIDETTFAKQGDQTPGVKHQYGGSLGKQANCAVTVHLAYNAPGGFRALPELLRVGLGRYPVERCFEEDKTEIGLNHFEVRSYCSLVRHLIISAVALLFLAEVRQEDVGEKKGSRRS